MISKNKFISALGLPGCGKTSVMREVARLLGTGYYFFEPEEKDWGEAVKDRESIGYFTGLTWFRSNRVPNLVKAHSIYEQGNNVVVDSYYDKAIDSYLGKKGMEWLLDTTDPYFPIAKQITEMDWRMLPNVTHLITFDISKDKWIRNLNIRNRQLDSDAELLKSYSTQKYFIEAAIKLSEDFGINHININVDNMTITETAELIVKTIYEEDGR